MSLARGVANRVSSRGGAQSAPARHTATAVNMGSGPSAAGRGLGLATTEP